MAPAISPPIQNAPPALPTAKPSTSTAVATAKKLSPAAQRQQDGYTSIKAMLDRNKASLAQALPKHLNADKLMRIALTCLRLNPALLECDQTSLLGALIQSAQLGLVPDPILGHAYLVPFKGQVKLIPGYKGLLHLCRNSDRMRSVSVHVVKDNDFFDFEFGLEEKLKHKPTMDETPGATAYAYAVVKFTNGGYQFDVMTKVELDAIRARSAAANEGPWVTDTDEMYKKSVLKRVLKLCPQSPELTRALALDNAAEAGQTQDFDISFEDPVGAVHSTEPVVSRLDGLMQSNPDVKQLPAPSTEKIEMSAGTSRETVPVKKPAAAPPPVTSLNPPAAAGPAKPARGPRLAPKAAEPAPPPVAQPEPESSQDEADAREPGDDDDALDIKVTHAIVDRYKKISKQTGPPRWEITLLPEPGRTILVYTGYVELLRAAAKSAEEQLAMHFAYAAGAEPELLAVAESKPEAEKSAVEELERRSAQ